MNLYEVFLETIKQPDPEHIKRIKRREMWQVLGIFAAVVTFGAFLIGGGILLGYLIFAS
jgi:hypothetical protein